jgi:hypothetical protein
MLVGLILALLIGSAAASPLVIQIKDARLAGAVRVPEQHTNGPVSGVRGLTLLGSRRREQEVSCRFCF